MNKKAIIFSVAVSLLLVLALFVFPAPIKQASAQVASGGGEVIGWMWSSNIGWVKLNSNSSNSIKVVDSQMQGYAWSSNIGWINFNPATTTTDNYPGTPRHGVLIEADGKVSGWARACSVFKTGCSGPLKDDVVTGLWSGWVKMVNTTYDPSSNIFSGYAWGDLNIGWLKFWPGKGEPCTCSNQHDGCPAMCCGGCCGGNCPPTLSCLIETENGSSDGHAALGEKITWTVSGTKLDPEKEYTYTWDGNLGEEPDPDPRETNTPFFTNYYNTAGTYNIDVGVSDNGSHLGTTTCKTNTGTDIIVDNEYALSMACSNGKIIEVDAEGKDVETLCENLSADERVVKTYPASGATYNLGVRPFADTGYYFSEYGGEFGTICNPTGNGWVPYDKEAQPINNLCRFNVDKTGILDGVFPQNTGCKFTFPGEIPGGEHNYFPVGVSIMNESLPKSSSFDYEGQSVEFESCGGTDNKFTLTFEVWRIDPETGEESEDFTYDQVAGTGVNIFCNEDDNEDTPNGGCSFNGLKPTPKIRARFYSLPDGPGTKDGTYYYVIKTFVNDEPDPLERPIPLEFTYTIGG